MRLGGSQHPLLAFVFLVSAAAGSSSAAPAGDQAPPSFSAATEVVTVDVLVLDAQGQPVSGLGREDFRVLEDGKPQTVTSFEAVEAKLPAAEPPAAAASPASRVVSNAAPLPTRRTFGIVFDDLHLDPLQIEPMRKALRAFLARETRPGDRLVLLTTSDGRFWTTTGGAESASFTAGLEQVTSHRKLQLGDDRRITPFEALSMSRENRGDPKQPDMEGDTTSSRVVRRQAAAAGHPAGKLGLGPERAQGWETWEEAYGLAVESVERSLAALRDGIAMLGAQRDRKALVLVSEGFIMDPLLHGFHAVRDVAARSNVVLYFLDARGLATRPEFFGVEGGGYVPPRDVGMTMVDWRQEAAGAMTLAEETGGLSLQTNDVQAALQRVADESRATYLLGYEPPSSRRDGRYHELKIELRRLGLSVRARAGYFAAKDEKGAGKAAPDAVERALQDPFDRAEIPLRLAAYVLGKAPMDADKEALEVILAGELRQDAPESRVADGRSVAEPRLLLSVGRRERPSEITELRLKLPAAAAAPEQTPADERWRPFTTRVLLEPGDNRLRLVAASGSRVGSLTTDLVVPQRDEERLSTPILSNVRAREGRLPVLPIARRRFVQADTLHCWVELQGAPPAPETGRPRTSASFRVRSADGREWAKGSFEGKAGAHELTGWLVSVPLGGAPAGESELLLTVRDLVSGGSFEAREPFSVEPPLVAPSASAAAADVPEDAGKAVETDGREPALATVLARAGAYVLRYGESFRNLVADEAYRQVEFYPAGNLSPRRFCNLRSDVAFVPLPGEIPWGTFRDVYDVDGEKVHDRDQRLEQLFAKPSSSSYEQARAILREGARYNLGEHGMDRTVNSPTLGLLFLLPQNQGRLTFKRKGEKTIAGVRAVELAFQETTRPTLVRDHWNSDAAASGRFWIDPSRGTVLQTRIEYDLEKSKRIVDRERWATGVVVTEFRREPALDIFVPDTMTDWYMVGSDKYLEGRASYATYRRFQVQSDWEVTDTKPGEPSAQPPLQED